MKENEFLLDTYNEHEDTHKYEKIIGTEDLIPRIVELTKQKVLYAVYSLNCIIDET